MRDMVAHGEADHLVPERVWQEVARGLCEARPSQLVRVLADCGLLARLDLRTLEQHAFTPALAASPLLAHAGLTERWCWLVAGESDPGRLRALCERWRVPTAERDLALLVQRERHALRTADVGDVDGLMALFERCDAWRKPQRLRQALDVIDGEALQTGPEQTTRVHASTQGLRQALDRLQSLDTAAITRAALAEGAQGPAVGEHLRQARRAHLLSRD